MKFRLSPSRLAKSFLVIFTAMIIAISSAPMASAQQSPTFDFDSVLNTYFDDTSGLISFTNYRVIFTPESAFIAQVAVLNATNEIVDSFSFYPEYRPREGVFAGAQVQTPADVSLTEPGIYTLVFVVDDKPVTRMPVRLVQSSAGDDPFNPDKTFQFDGYWRTLAYLTMGTYKGEAFPELHYWLGGMDLAKGAKKALPW